MYAGYTLNFELARGLLAAFRALERFESRRVAAGAPSELAAARKRA
jgi:hypothetical protein